MPITTPVDVKFGVDEDKALDKFVDDNLTALKNSYSKLHKEKVPKWRRLYKGIPREQTRDFPWPNASNVVVQLIGENCDIIKAIMLGSIYEILPLWVAGLVGDWTPQEEGEEQRSAVERFLDLMGLKSDELDLYRVESLAANDIAQFGTVVIKSPWETETEQLVVAASSDERGNPASSDFTKYDGPRPEKLPIEDWAATPTAPTWEKAKFKYHHYTLHKDKMEEKFFLGLFNKGDKDETMKKILGQPDRTGVDTEVQQKLANQNINAPASESGLAEWDIYECWFTYWHNNKRYKIIYSYHQATKTRLRAVFDFYPKNDEPFELGRLGYTDDGLIGYGFAEMGEMYQEECSTGHNQRVDNRTLANTSIIFSKDSKMDAGFGLYPMAVLPFDPQTTEIAQMGVINPSTVNEEEMTIALAKARFGTNVSDAQGTGSGTVSKKGQYSSMGTFSVMQQGTRRLNINITDFRYMHLKLGQRFLNQYAEFGIGKRQNYLGEQGKYLIKALSNLKKGRIELPIRAATASINKEIEKQNGMLFTQVMQRHYASIAQVLQGVSNPTMPPELKQYLFGTIGGMAYVMSKLLRAFGYDDVYRMQPELEILKQLRSQENGQQSNQGTKTQTNGSGQGVPSVQGASQEEGVLQGSEESSGIQGAGGLPQSDALPI